MRVVEMVEGANPQPRTRTMSRIQILGEPGSRSGSRTQGFDFVHKTCDTFLSNVGIFIFTSNRFYTHTVSSIQKGLNTLCCDANTSIPLLDRLGLCLE